MISASTAFLQKVNNGEIPLMRMQLTTARGRTIWLEDGQFWGQSVSFNEATSQDNAFSVGDAVIGGFSFSLTNFDRSLDSIEFEGAVVVPFVYFEINGTKEYLPKGIFYVTSHTTSGNIIRCTAMDALKLLDQSSTPITYPITVQNLVVTICNANGITLDTTTIPHGDFVLPEPEKDTSGNSTVITDRQMLSYACQCIGCFARMNELGHLEVKWYDFESPVVISTTFDGKSLWTSPITVTGISIDVGNGTSALMVMSIDPNGTLNYIRTSEVTDTFVIDSSGNLIATAESGTTYTINTSGQLVRTGEAIPAPQTEGSGNDSVSILYGTDDRVIKISGNPYITVNNVLAVCQNISNAIFAKPFRPGTLPVLGNPCLQAGDVLQVTDRTTGLVYMMPITSTTYDKTLTQNINCAFEQKADADLRPNASYNMKVSVANAMAQAQAADELAQAARDLAETSGYQPYIVSDKGTAFAVDTTANLTAIIYDMDMNEVDPQGTDVIYRWWVARDGVRASYLGGGKWINVPVSDKLCDYAAGIYFETKDISEGINPFLLAKRNDAVILTTRAGVPLSARAAEVYG
jgi:TATA-box binding protein (TBP) (component of TFIID and TFIIIB)